MNETVELRLKIEGPDAPAEIPVKPGETTIGRQPGSDLQLSDPIVSRNHARLVRSAEGCVLIDLGSANGTYLNDQKLQPEVPTPCEPGDLIRIGPYSLHLEILPSPEEAVEPVRTPEPISAEEIKPAGEGKKPVKEKKPKDDKPDTGKGEPPPPPSPPPGEELFDPGFPVPPGLSVESRRLINFLPGIYHTDFLRRFLGIFESILMPVEWTIDNYDLFLNPATAPEGFLTWLANWFQLGWGPGWSPKKRRAFLQEAQQIYARRGTRWALSRVLEIYTGEAPEIIDTGDDLPAYTFQVRLAAGSQVPNLSQIEELINAHKPAHTTYTLELK